VHGSFRRRPVKKATRFRSLSQRGDFFGAHVLGHVGVILRAHELRRLRFFRGLRFRHQSHQWTLFTERILDFRTGVEFRCMHRVVKNSARLQKISARQKHNTYIFFTINFFLSFSSPDKIEILSPMRFAPHERNYTKTLVSRLRQPHQTLVATHHFISHSWIVTQTFFQSNNTTTHRKTQTHKPCKHVKLAPPVAPRSEISWGNPRNSNGRPHSTRRRLDA